ncbi:S1 RNA-binding domain-containing protein, partial [Pelagibacteraceae bacterium]|nr:S1 RNA-binding domain-containing protein [Pelagibacteraceae bacterium]
GIVQNSTQNGIYLQFGKKNLSILIKKNQLAKEIENQRPSRFVKGDKLDALISELDKEKRKVSLSIKALEEKQTKEAVKKYGSKDSGGILSDIFDFSKVKTKPKKKK